MNFLPSLDFERDGDLDFAGEADLCYLSAGDARLPRDLERDLLGLGLPLVPSFVIGLRLL